MRNWRTQLGLVLAAAMLLAAPAVGQEALFDAATRDFASQVDLEGFQTLSAQQGGRVKILDSVARSQVAGFNGKASIDGTSPTFSFLEMVFNAGPYLNKPVIDVYSGNLRDRLLPLVSHETADALRRTNHLIPMGLLNPQSVQMLIAQHRATLKEFDPNRISKDLPALQALNQDLKLRSMLERLSQSIDTFMSLGSIRLIPPESGDVYEMIGDLTPADPLTSQFADLRDSWRQRDVKKTNQLLGQIHASLVKRSLANAPAAWQRELEIYHNRLAGFSIGWIGFAVATLPLLVAVATGKRRWGQLGLGIFLASALFMVAGFAIRWILSGRGWALPPFTNQFESVLTAAVMASVAGAVLEILFAKRFFALAASLFCCIALLGAFILPDRLGWQIEAPHGILNSPILSVHVATLMIGYAVIGMSLMLSIAYLGIILVQRLMGVRTSDPSAGFDLTGPGGAIPGEHGLEHHGHGGILADLDRGNLILIQLGCWLVGVGVALGSFWGDQAWGRWWGWDPKETWGLETFLVFLGILHLRFILPRRRRGLWTAALAILGCLVMAFTWFGVNYLLAGLHSYA